MIRIDQNLELRPVSLASSGIVFESIHQSRVHLRRWLPFVDATKNVSDTQNFIKSVLRNPCLKQDMVFEIWHSTIFAGLISFKEIDKTNNKLELGYWLDQSMTGKGIMVRSVKKLIDHAFQKMKMNRVMIKVAVGNDKSIAIPKKLGFNFEGVEQAGEFMNGRYQDLEIYSMLTKDWNQLWKLA